MAEKKPSLINNARASKRPHLIHWILLGLGLVLSVVLYVFLSAFVSCWRLTSLPGIPLPKCSASSSSPAPIVTNASGTPIAQTATQTLSAPEVQLPPPWDGASRVTVLILGLRGGDTNENCPLCTDTMILLTIDPVSKTAGMLSIPRDMWVDIPGFTYNRINAAYTTGELYKLPGGGPGLTMKTVENFLGIPIQYYAQIDFDAFAKMIDDIGGICMNIPTKVKVGVMNQHGVTVIRPGYQCLNGEVALGYARTRDIAQGVQGGDVERSQNQQRVILAVRDKILANFPTLIAKAGPLYNEISSGVHTNLSFDDILRLGMLAKDIPLNSIQQGVIDYTMMIDQTTTINGVPADVLRPFPDKIRELVNQIFGSDAIQPTAKRDPAQLMKQEAARVLVINGSSAAGIATKTADYLKAQGLNVIGTGNMADYPDQYNSPPLPTRTLLIVHAGKPYAIKYLMALMKFNSANQLVMDFDPTAASDITLAIGVDWAQSNPMP